MKYKPTKTVMQITYKPKLDYFDKIYNKPISEYFPDWITDRLKITFRDFNKHHSLTISHNNILFESDKYDKKSEEDVFKLIVDNLVDISEEENFTRFGLRRFFLIKQDISYEELIEIFNLKVYSNDLIDQFKNSISNSNIVIDTYIDDYKIHITMGPMKKDEISRFIKFNIEQHSDPKSMERVNILSQEFNSYPDVSLYIDLDFSLNGEKLNSKQIEEFLSTYNNTVIPLIESLSDNLFKEKL